VAHLLGNLSQLSLYNILVYGQALKLGIEFAHGLTKSLVHLALSLNEALSHALQVGLLSWRLWRLKLRGTILKTGRVRMIL